MNSYQKEQLENVRRTCDAALDNTMLPAGALDAFLHILNLIELIKDNE